jgi:TPR repeat protein
MRFALGLVLVALVFSQSIYGLDEKARQELIQKAESGDPLAQNDLAACYMLGQSGFPEDKEKGVELYRKSAEQGCPKGMLNLGILSKTVTGLIRTTKRP